MRCPRWRRCATPKPSAASWDPDFSLYTWYTEQDGDDTVLYANFQGKDPNAETVECSVRSACFAPMEVAFEPEQRFENPDGSPLRLDRDFAGAQRSGTVLPGPFADGSGVRQPPA